MESTTPSPTTTDGRTSGCSLGPADRDTRLREWQSLRNDALICEDANPERTVAVFTRSDDVMSRLQALIDAEKGCCSFLRFKVTEEGENITVVITSATEGD